MAQKPPAQLPPSSDQPSTEINLEKVLLVEDKIWTLLEVHRFLERVLNNPRDNEEVKQSVE